MPFLDTMVLLVIEHLSGLAWTFPLRATECLTRRKNDTAACADDGGERHQILTCPRGTYDCALFLARTALPTSDVVSSSLSRRVYRSSAAPAVLQRAPLRTFY